jgi:UDP-N-acetylmuramate dehydrogenase
VSWRDRLPPVQGRLLFDAVLAPYTWLRVGGPADVLFLPKDERDLAQFLAALDPGAPVAVLGVGSNTLVRDGGIEGVVVRLGKSFAGVAVAGRRVTAGAGALDKAAAAAAASAGVAGLEFFTGVPGSVGGALAMNAGCYGRETKDVLISAVALDRTGRRRIIPRADLGFGYRRAEGAAGLIFIEATFEGEAGDPRAILEAMDKITAQREASQPIREKTSGSTFKNPVSAAGEALSAWRLVDQAGWRGKLIGGAMMSPQHANFLINAGDAAASDLEALGERVRADVLAKFGIDLEWEVKRVGRPAPARGTAAAPEA